MQQGYIATCRRYQFARDRSIAREASAAPAATFETLLPYMSISLLRLLDDSLK
jgi:hypothetical protein